MSDRIGRLERIITELLRTHGRQNQELGSALNLVLASYKAGDIALVHERLGQVVRQRRDDLLAQDSAKRN